MLSDPSLCISLRSHMPEPCPLLCHAGATQVIHLPVPSSPHSHHHPSSAKQLSALSCSLSSLSGSFLLAEHAAAGFWIVGVWPHSAAGFSLAWAASKPLPQPLPPCYSPHIPSTSSLVLPHTAVISECCHGQARKRFCFYWGFSIAGDEQ